MSNDKKNSKKRKMSEAHKKAISEALKGKPKSEKHKESLRSIQRTEEHKSNLKKALNDPKVFEKRKKTAIKKYGKIRPDDKNYFKKEYWISKGLSGQEAKEKISELQKNFSSSQKRKVQSHWKEEYWIKKGLSKEEAKRKISELQIKNASKSKMTVSKAEKKFLDKLEDEIGIKIKRGHVVAGKFKVDGFLENLNIVIEYFGLFWHMHPDFFEPEDTHRVTGWKAKSKWAEDNGRIKYLEKAVGKTFVVWENENIDSKIKEIKKYIEENYNEN